MKFRPLHDRVAIKQVAGEEKTAGGIIIPDSAKEKPLRGKVIAIGEGAYDSNGNKIPMNVKVGDEVLYAKWGSNEVKIDGEEILIMKESDILGIIA